MRKWELVKQSTLTEIKNEILSNLFNKEYGLKLWEFNRYTTGTERVKSWCKFVLTSVNNKPDDGRGILS